MAYASDIRSIEGGLMDRMHAVKKAFSKARAQRRVYRSTYAELSTLSERELDDLGIHVSQIPFIAREAANSTN